MQAWRNVTLPSWCWQPLRTLQHCPGRVITSQQVLGHQASQVTVHGSSGFWFAEHSKAASLANHSKLDASHTSRRPTVPPPCSYIFSQRRLATCLFRAIILPSTRSNQFETCSIYNGMTGLQLLLHNFINNISVIPWR